MHKPDDIRLLVVEDEPELREAMIAYLRLEGFQCSGAGSLRAARQWLDMQTPEILLLDLGLPDGESLTLLDDPSLSHVGVIITTARGRAEDRLIGARKGADAYLIKPIQLEELAMVIRNLHRRLKAQRVSEPLFGLTPQSVSKPRPVSEPQSGWRLQRIHWTLISPMGVSLVLTRSEALVLTELAMTVGVGAPRNTLITCLGHDPATYDWRRMEILMRRLRNKCKAAFGVELPLRTLHGFGYAFTETIALD